MRRHRRDVDPELPGDLRRVARERVRRRDRGELATETVELFARALSVARLERAFAAGLTFRTGTCSVPEELPALFPLVQSGRLRPEKYISHRMPLSEGAEAYRLFEAREAGALKMVLTP